MGSKKLERRKWWWWWWCVLYRMQQIRSEREINFPNHVWWSFGLSGGIFPKLQKSFFLVGMHSIQQKGTRKKRTLRQFLLEGVSCWVSKDTLLCHRFGQDGWRIGQDGWLEDVKYSIHAAFWHMRTPSASISRKQISAVNLRNFLPRKGGEYIEGHCSFGWHQVISLFK